MTGASALLAKLLQYLDDGKTGVQIPVRPSVCSRYVIGVISWMHTEGLLLSSLNCVGQQIIKCRGALQFVTGACAGGWMGWLQGLKCNF